MINKSTSAIIGLEQIIVGNFQDPHHVIIISYYKLNTTQGIV